MPKPSAYPSSSPALLFFLIPGSYGLQERAEPIINRSALLAVTRQPKRQRILSQPLKQRICKNSTVAYLARPRMDRSIAASYADPSHGHRPQRFPPASRAPRGIASKSDPDHSVVKTPYRGADCIWAKVCPNSVALILAPPPTKIPECAEFEQYPLPGSRFHSRYVCRL